MASMSEDLPSSILVEEILRQILDASKSIETKCRYAHSSDDFIETETGQEKLDSICIRLIAIGESLKRIDRLTHYEFLQKYPEVEWKKIKGIRDFISHHYFDLDAEIIFEICQKHIHRLTQTIETILIELTKGVP